MFYHFPSRLALGYAVVEEEILEAIEQRWVTPLAEAPKPVEALAELIENFAKSIPKAQFLLGCPLNNLAQEMSPLDEGFRQATARVFAVWLSALENALKRGQRAGRITRSVSAREAALALLALFEGGVSLSKNAQNRRPLLASARASHRYLESLAP